MAAVQLDHVNIRTTRLAACLDFYGTLLGLALRPPPMATDMDGGAYACDAAGHPVVHLVRTDTLVAGGGAVRGAAQPGMIDHFALRCSGDPVAYADRLSAAGQSFEQMDVAAIDLHLIFVRDPNGVMVELGFPLATGMPT